MSKLIFDSLDVSKKQTKKYVVLDKWHEKTISDSLLEKKNIDYLNAFIFSIEDESNEVDMVDDIYEKLLFELSKKLNKIHGINWSLRSWRIFIGPWVNRFVAIIYDRVKILLPLANNNEINCERQIEIGKNIALASFDMRDFTDKILKKEWNDKLMCRIIYILKKNNFSNEINLKNSLKIKFEQKIHKVYYFLNFLFFNFLKILFYPFTHKNKYIFYKPYFGSLKNTIKFILKLRDIPIKYSFSFFDNFRVRKNISFKLRSEFSVETKTKDIREKITRLLVAECMPTIYLEGFSNLKRISNNCYLPKKSKVIVTFNSWRDNIFKFWLSNQVNNGAKLIYGQHGAGYGTNLKHYAERHELKICDTYLSWGWKGNSDKIYPVGDFSSFNKKDFKYVKNKKILIVAGNINIYKVHNIILNKNEVILREQQMNSLLSLLDYRRIGSIDLKEHPNDKRRDTSIRKVIQSKKIKINIIKYKNNFDNLINNYEFLIFPYQFATPFLKYLSLNKTCLSFFDLRYIDDNFKKDFTPLFDNNILHTSSEKMSNFINLNFENMEEWWNDDKTQEARKTFCKKFINKSINFTTLVDKFKKL